MTYRRIAQQLFTTWAAENISYVAAPLELFRTYDRSNLRNDLQAGLTVAVVLLPQAIAYALIAELPPSVGLYTAVVTSIVAALWGSSATLHTGPTNAASLLVLATLLSVAEPGTTEFVLAAGLMAAIGGVIRLGMAFFRLGALVYFVSDSVITGFTAGAGFLIIVNQLRPLLKLDFNASPLFLVTLWRAIRNISETHLPSLLIGLLTMVIIVLVKRFRPKYPSALIGMSSAALVVFLLGLDERGVSVLGDVPTGLPPFTALPLDLDLINGILTGAIAAAVIGIVEAMSIARAMAAQTGERLETNQEFVGQGLALLITGFFGGYPASGSFTRSAINFNAGAKSRMAAIFSGLWVLVAVLLFGRLVAFLPRPALAGVLLITAYSMIDREEIRRTINASFGDTVIMLATFLAALLLPLQYAVLSGVFVAFMRYVRKTSTPLVTNVLPDEEYEHFEPIEEDETLCPQLSVVTISGSLYFGAVNHVEQKLRTNMEARPSQKFLLLRMHRVNHIDMTGIHMLESIVRLYRQRGGDVFMMRVHTPVMDWFVQTGFDHLLGFENFLAPENGISYLFHRVLNPAYCIYACPVKVWKECDRAPKSHNPGFVPRYELAEPETEVPSIKPEALYRRIEEDDRLLVIDIREPQEFGNGFISESQMIPLPRFFERSLNLPASYDIIFVSGSGRRSRHLVNRLRNEKWRNVYNLQGGIVAWRNAYLPLETMRVGQSPIDTP